MLPCCQFSQVSICRSGLSGLIACYSIVANIILAARLILFVCSGYLFKMSSIPQGAFASFKIRQGMDGKGYNKLKEEKCFPPVNKKLVEHSPLKYNSKMMNSIWGQYNRYSVHNMKKNTDSNEMLLWAEQRLATATPPAFHVPGFTPDFFN
ncbi:uncharacterized protein LOC128990722 [Macrosteles quadrilineatus]|uniref:uncharacterized protein LOC128990722 n=1 Tax=Macrosteles quadrilineatus TaxID=74068 RepID=UPI0023E2882B|nr:uncharacterized protein LOC128990722 [Macrosteles quadrilineatus]